MVGGQRGMQVGRAGAAGQGVQVQRNGQHDALAVVAVGRQEDRPHLQAGMVLDLGHMLVVQAQAVHLQRRCAGAGRLMLGDARLAAARVARHRVDGQRLRGRQQAGVDQRPQQGQRAGGIAAWVADARGCGDARRLAGRQLGQAVDPARRRAVGRAGVDQPHTRPPHQRDGGAGGVVWKAQQGDVAGVQRLGAAGGVAALGVGQGQQAQVGARAQAVQQLQAGGALVTVDEHEGLGHGVVLEVGQNHHAHCHACIRQVESVERQIPNL